MFISAWYLSYFIERENSDIKRKNNHAIQFLKKTIIHNNGIDCIKERKKDEIKFRQNNVL